MTLNICEHLTLRYDNYQSHGLALSGPEVMKLLVPTKYTLHPLDH
jgi:hypothetical protein